MSLLEEMNQKATAQGIPLSAHLDITWRCNERCVHCYLDHDGKDEMSTAEIKDVIRQLAECGTFFLSISGGEPLLRRDCFEILEYARELRFNVKLKTNAVMIGAKEAARLKQLGIEQVQISIYSDRPEIHDAITKLPGSLRRSLEAIRHLKAQGVKVSITNVLMKQNVTSGKAVQQLAKELDVAFVIDPRGVPHRRVCGERGRVLRSCFDCRRQRAGRLQLQCGPYAGVYCTERRRIPLRAVPHALRKPAREDFSRDLVALRGADGVAHYPGTRPAHVFAVRPCCLLHALPGPGLHGRKHARAIELRLRQV